MARRRSPNYPGVSLPAAIDTTRLLDEKHGDGPLDRAAIAKIIGYAGVGGISATLFSALRKYGLLTASGNREFRISDLARRILGPSEKERHSAIVEAAFNPPLFHDIQANWPHGSPGDRVLHTYLRRRGFSPRGMEQVVRAYRETIAFVSQSAAAEEQAVDRPLPGAAHGAPEPDVAQGSPADPADPAPGAPFSVTFDGAVLTGSFVLRSAEDVDRLVRVLDAQKAAFDAMQATALPSDAALAEPEPPFPRIGPRALPHWLNRRIDPLQA